MRPKVVEVTWEDSWSSNSNWTVDELKREPGMILHSTGYLINRDKKGIDLAGEYRENREMGRHIQHIVASTIIKVRELK